MVVQVDGDLEPIEIVRELGKVTCEDRLGRVGGDLFKRLRKAHLISEAPRKHGGALFLDLRRRVDGRLFRGLARRCVGLGLG